jgi:hypothetical protein
MIADAIQQTPAIRNGEATNPAASHQNITPPEAVKVYAMWGNFGLATRKEITKGRS